MERFSQRESVLLGYSPQRIFTNNHPIFHSPDNSPDIDFNDVFGGPPRRVSIQETRYSFGDYNDANSPSYALTSTANAHHAQRWSGLGEKPVFGEESSNSNRRRYTNSDFFDDIFKGSESVSSSPRKSDRDSFSLSSRVLSPAPSLPPRASDPPLPAQFSLPARLIKGTDLPTFGSSGRHHHKDGSSNGVSFYSQSPLSRFSNQVQEDVSLHKSTSQEFSVSSGESWSTAKPDETDKSNNSTKDSTNSVGTNSNSNFHFSIYKWASKGVPLGFPTRGGNSSKLKEKTKLERSSSASGRIVYQGMTKELHTVTSQDTGSLPFSNNISSDDKPSEIELDKKGNGLLHPTSTINGTKDKGLNVEGAVLRKIVPETVSDSSGNISLHDSKGVSKTLPNAARGKAGKGDDNSKITRDNSKTDLRTLHSLISGDEEKTIKIESKESKVKHTKKSAAVFDVDEKVKKQNEESIRLNGNDRDEKSNSPRNSQDGLTKNRSRGKVKEFVKIFNQESSKKPTVNAEPQNRSSRWKKKPKANPDDVSNVTKPDKKTQLPNGNKSHKQDPPAKVDGFLKQFDKQHFEPRADNYLNATDISSGLEDKSATTAAPIPDGSEAGDSDYSFQENILIKELPQDDELPEATDNQDEYQFIDVKIRKWSNGKEGNIRSLLSTLQYVLWPGSGWKPVPLVDIIEGNAVKRSYQKALLSLHPDKLQQKGATSQQKYIAEKVFDILQEAWTHFSSLDSV